MQKENYDKYECEKCGSCCRYAFLITENYGKDIFPYNTKEDGSCEMLNDDNLCKVYETRPIICNMKLLCEYLNIDNDEFYSENKKICKILKLNGLR